MINSEYTVNTLEDFKNLETWLFGLTFPLEMNVSIYCHENHTTYFYKRELVNNKYTLITDGESN